jgi:hypothetical protein
MRRRSSRLRRAWRHGSSIRGLASKVGLGPLVHDDPRPTERIWRPLHGSDPETLLKRMEARPSVFFIHGNGYTYRAAVKEAVRIRAVLEANGGLPSDTVFIIFDWPSERVFLYLYLDYNEKSRRSRVASYHLALFLQTVPAGSKICLLGQSDGGRIVLTTLHLLSGAPLPAFWSEPQIQLSSSRQDLRLRGVVLDAAAGHHWLNPGERLDQALPTCESLLNLRNCGDHVLAAYALGVYTGIRPALGRVGLRAHDLKNLGLLAARVEQINIYPMVGISHTSFPEALAVPDVANRIVRFTSWSDISPLASVVGRRDRRLWRGRSLSCRSDGPFSAASQRRAPVARGIHAPPRTGCVGSRPLSGGNARLS